MLKGAKLLMLSLVDSPLYLLTIITIENIFLKGYCYTTYGPTCNCFHRTLPYTAIRAQITPPFIFDFSFLF